MSKPQQPPPETKRKARSAEHLAAGAAIQLARIDASIVKARETLAAKEAEKAAVIDGLDEPVRVLVKRMRGETGD